MTSKPENQDRLRIEQYIQCAEDIRHYNNGLWQITSINITVAGVMIGIAFEFLFGFFRIFPLLVAVMLSLALTITLSKYIFFQLGRANFMREIERFYTVESIPYSSEDIAKFLEKKDVQLDAPTRWFVGEKANRWLTSVMLGVTILLIVLLVLIVISPQIPPLNQIFQNLPATNSTG